MWRWKFFDVQTCTLFRHHSYLVTNKCTDVYPRGFVTSCNDVRTCGCVLMHIMWVCMWWQGACLRLCPQTPLLLSSATTGGSWGSEASGPSTCMLSIDVFVSPTVYVLSHFAHRLCPVALCPPSMPCRVLPTVVQYMNSDLGHFASMCAFSMHTVQCMVGLGARHGFTRYFRLHDFGLHAFKFAVC